MVREQNGFKVSVVPESRAEGPALGRVFAPHTGTSEQGQVSRDLSDLSSPEVLRLEEMSLPDVRGPARVGVAAQHLPPGVDRPRGHHHQPPVCLHRLATASRRSVGLPWNSVECWEDNWNWSKTTLGTVLCTELGWTRCFRTRWSQRSRKLFESPAPRTEWHRSVPRCPPRRSGWSRRPWCPACAPGWRPAWGRWPTGRGGCPSARGTWGRWGSSRPAGRPSPSWGWACLGRGSSAGTPACGRRGRGRSGCRAGGCRRSTRLCRSRGEAGSRTHSTRRTAAWVPTPRASPPGRCPRPPSAWWPPGTSPGPPSPPPPPRPRLGPGHVRQERAEF